MKILIKDLIIPTLIGAYAHERASKQDLVYNFEIKISTEKSTKTDQLEDTINYDELCEKVREVANTTNFKLLEALIVRLKDEMFLSFAQIKYIKIRIGKPGIIKDCTIIEVEEEYSKGS